MTDSNRQIDRYLQNKLDAYIAEVAGLCTQPSISARREGTLECAHLVVQALEHHGFDVTECDTPGDPIIVGHLKGNSKRTLLFYNHYDVQPPEPLELWTTPPFQPAVRDGALYARGTSDDKGEFVARLAAVDAARAANGGTSPCAITFVVEGAEEIGSPHIAAFVQEHKDMLKCEGAIWEGGNIDPNGNPYNTLGYRGALAVKLQVETMRRDSHSGNANLLRSAAWILTWVLGALKGPDERVRIPGFYNGVVPPSALDLELADALPAHEELVRGIYGIKEFLLGLTGLGLNRAVFQPTCNIQGITSGYQGEGTKSIIPAMASAVLDFRLVPDQDPDDILAKLRSHLSAQGYGDVKVTPLVSMWPAKTSAVDPLVTLASRTGEEVYGVPTLLDPLSGGSSPVYAFAKPLGGIPVISVGVGYWDNRAHAPNEHVRLVDFLNGSRHIARIVDGYADLPTIADQKQPAA